uniref:Uncharacterized protein n=1 Tax=Amphimedon queenslandica TaxID=400682 RepID=A0A1X7TXK1_AMPQE
NTLKSIPIYCTSNDGVQYIRDKEGKLTVRKIGELVLNIPNPEFLIIYQGKRDI